MSALHIRIGRGGALRLPADIALSLIPSMPRPHLERLVQRLIDGLDDMDAPDEDREDDDPAGMMDEDELTTGPGVIATHGVTYDGPGCPISDPGEEGCRRLPPLAMDGEDAGVIILPGPQGTDPTHFRVS